MTEKRNKSNDREPLIGIFIFSILWPLMLFEGPRAILLSICQGVLVFVVLVVAAVVLGTFVNSFINGDWI